MKPKHRRLLFILGCLGVMALGTAAILTAFRDSMVYFYTPSQLAEKRGTADFDTTRPIRIGGLVKHGSVENLKPAGLAFTITDLTAEVPVTYLGMVPSLFREGQGVVAQGTLAADGSFTAATILAKHDENYMPKNVVDALKASGQWREGTP